MAVPFFFISSGYLLSKKLNFPYLEKDISILKKTYDKDFKIISYLDVDIYTLINSS